MTPRQLEYQRKWRRANPEKTRAYWRKWYHKNKHTNAASTRAYYRRHAERVKHRTILRRYGLSNDQYAELLIAQDGRCGICEIELRKPNVDHNHKTGEIRGLLCQRCNTRVVALLDEPSLLEKAVAYLARFPNQHSEA